MYNGVGLSTPRGSGTSGHVQRNFAAILMREKDRRSEESSSEPIIRKANKELLEHEKKRQIEIECIELSDKLESDGYTQEEIDTEVETYRKMKLEYYEKSREHELSDDIRIRNSHQSAEAQHKRNTKLEEAFGLSTSHSPCIITQNEK